MNVLELLQKKLPLSRSELLLLIATAPNRYKVHTIDKRHNRGKRVIAQPTAEVKALQKLLLGILRGKLPVHSCAKAYQPGTSIRDHALPHAPNRYLLKLDFKDFFPSIKGGDFSSHIKRHLDIPDVEIEIFTHAFFWTPKKTMDFVLAIGAPSSPWISNTILFEFDELLTDYCDSKNVKYTRYADDLAFSTNTPHVLKDVHTFVQDICKEIAYPRLNINESKTVFTSKKNSRSLTGLILSNEGSVSIGRAKKREIRAMAHKYQIGALDLESTLHLQGLLAFMQSIDPDFNQSIARMVGNDRYLTLTKQLQ